MEQFILIVIVGIVAGIRALINYLAENSAITGDVEHGEPLLEPEQPMREVTPREAAKAALRRERARERMQQRSAEPASGNEPVPDTFSNIAERHVEIHVPESEVVPKSSCRQSSFQAGRRSMRYAIIAREVLERPRAYDI